MIMEKMMMAGAVVVLHCFAITHSQGEAMEKLSSVSCLPKSRFPLVSCFKQEKRRDHETCPIRIFLFPFISTFNKKDVSNMTVQDLKVAPTPGKKTVLLFWAEWHEGSTGPMTDLLHALDTTVTSSGVHLARIEAEAVPSVSSQFNVTVVPTFILLNEAGSVVERLEGVEDASEVTRAVMKLQVAPPATISNEASSTISSPAQTEEELLNKRLEKLVKSSEVMLFMKGVPSGPRCGFSRQAVEMLQEEQIPFGSFDIFTDEAVRQGLKQYSNWPTYPQLYVNGELVGGLDILKEMKEEGSLRDQLDITATAEPPLSLNDRIKKLIHQSNVMLFMKGLPSAPRCGFSRQMVEILNEEKVPFEAFDILQDEEIRQGLKDYSDWPTYPQLYVAGDLVGGLDIIKEMKEDGSLKDALMSDSS